MKASLSSQILSSTFLDVGVVESQNGKLWKIVKFYPVESGKLEENLAGENATAFFSKTSELLSKGGLAVLLVF